MYWNNREQKRLQELGLPSLEPVSALFFTLRLKAPVISAGWVALSGYERSPQQFCGCAASGSSCASGMRAIEPAEEFVAKGAGSLISVVERVKRLPRRWRCYLITGTLLSRTPDVVGLRLRSFPKKKGVSFFDLLILEIARKNGAGPVGEA